jgi:uncharacterized protein YkwD/murein DD-endopeptidase MepM/ murein hydrolase activator NlpD
VGAASALVLVLLAALPAASGQVGRSDFAERVVVLTNQERARRGLPPLKPNGVLHEAARLHAEDMARHAYFSHQGRDGRSSMLRMRALGYEGNAFGENIAMGQRTPEEVVQSWMKSAGHRENILNRAFREMGVGVAERNQGQGGARRLWVQTFGARLDHFPVVAALGAENLRESAVDLYIYGEGWARRMRLRNEDGAFAPWQPFSRTLRWELSPGSGLKKVTVELEGERGEVRSDTVTVTVSVRPEQSAPATNGARSQENAARRGSLPSRGAVARNARGMPLVPMVFPVLAGVKFSDTFGAPRGGGTRKHLGQDLMAPKMTPLLAAFDGTVYFSRQSAQNAHYSLTLFGDNGWSARYLHINNDTPGTDDGLGGTEHAFPAGLQPGDRVIAGQLIAWCGDSGNAEDSGSHLHFELWSEVGPESAFASLKAAEVLKAPRVNLPDLGASPDQGESRLDGVVRTVDAARSVVELDLIARVTPAGQALSILKPTRTWLKLGEARIVRKGEDGAALAFADLAVGDRIAVFAKEAGGAEAAVARAVTLLPPPTSAVAVTSRPPASAPDPAVAERPAEEKAAAQKPAEPPNTSAPPRAAEGEQRDAAREKRLARMLEVVNEARREAELPPLALNPRLTAAAEKHARDMAQNRLFQHEGTDGSSLEDRVRREGYTFLVLAQNMAYGLHLPEEAVAAWQTRSRETKANLLDRRMTEVGIGFSMGVDARDPLKERPYWVLVLGAPAAPPAQP